MHIINEEIKITNSEKIGNLKYILDSFGLSNLMINIFTVVEGYGCSNVARLFKK